MNVFHIEEIMIYYLQSKFNLVWIRILCTGSIQGYRPNGGLYRSLRKPGQGNKQPLFESETQPEHSQERYDNSHRQPDAQDGNG